MFSKYILKSNWTSLSCDYSFDNTIAIDSTHVPVDGNISLTYDAPLSGVLDYSNNNYSLFFLSKKSKLEHILASMAPMSLLNKQPCVLASNLTNGLVSEETSFLKLLPNFSVLFNKVNDLDNDNIFEIETTDTNNLFLYTVKNDVFYFLAVDDINLSITTLTAQDTNSLTAYQKDKVKLNFLYDNSNNTILFYKTILGKNYILSESGNSLALQANAIQNVVANNFFSVIKMSSLPSVKLGSSWLGYKSNLDNSSIDVDVQGSSNSLSHNYLIHSEYNNVQGDSLKINLLTLKNQFNISDEAPYSNLTSGKRSYNYIHTGGSRERGYENVSIGYASNLYPVNFKSDMTTWFHVPYNKKIKSTNINNSNFIPNGSIAGMSPLFSDKIFKKAANYSYSSNMGNVEDKEQSGSWLCAWLSGGDSNPVWVDRFYNPETFTPFQALRYTTNVDYTPQYQDKYGTGITDTVSTLTLEPGAWYAYSRLGKETASKVVGSYKHNIISNGLNSYLNLNKTALNFSLDADNDPIYVFNNQEYGEISLNNMSEYGNFTTSFFASKDNWNVFDSYQMFGNYTDNGFGVFNDVSINPMIFYTNGKDLKMINKDSNAILDIDIQTFVPGDSGVIVGYFRRDLITNFHVITDTKKLIEFTSNGTIVDLVDFSSRLTAEDVVHCSNNINNGYILGNNNTVLQVNLFSNAITNITNNVNIFNVNDDTFEDSNNSIIADNYDNVYVVQGKYPAIKGSLLYFKNTNSTELKVYNINTSTLNTYLTSGQDYFTSYTFTKQGETILLFRDKVNKYDALGQYVESMQIMSPTSLSLSGINLINCNLGQTEILQAHCISSSGKSYVYDLNSKLYKKIDDNTNVKINSNMNQLYNQTEDLSNWIFNQNVYASKYPLPCYVFKIKIFNQLDYEDARILEHVVLGESLNSGEHHFAITLDTIGGAFSLYIDGRLYRTIKFIPKKYSFSNLLKNTIVVGAVPFYGNSIYSDFYNSDKNFLFVKNVSINKLKLFNNAFSNSEIKMLYFEKYPPEDIKVDLPIGERNYLDTISRVFKFRGSGSKSNVINLYINDSLITDRNIQKLYETKILKHLNNTVPGHVKIEKIFWLNNKDSDEKMIAGNFNARNTITESQ